MPRTWQRVCWSLLAAVPLLAAVLWPVPGHHPLEVAGWAAGVAALLVAAAALVFGPRPPARPADLESFAAEVDRQWRAEVHARRLPLGVTDELHLSWTDGTVSGGIDHLVALCAAMPVPRLAVLGAAGSGKSSTLVLLTVGLLARRAPGDPVPVLFAVADWNPAREDMDAWLERRLRQYTTLTGGDAARHLVRDRKIVPVVDGLDEAPPDLRRRILRELAEAPGDMPFVVACRTAEFHAAGGGPRPDRLVEAELRPLTPDDAIRYLGARCQWDTPTVRADSPLAAALTSPLLVHLISTLCRAGRLTVTDLTAFATSADLEQHLLEAYLPTVFTAHADRLRKAGGRTERAGPLPRAWPPRAAHRWLTELAVDMTRTGRTEYRWWVGRRRYLYPTMSDRVLPSASPFPRRPGRVLTGAVLAAPLLYLAFVLWVAPSWWTDAVPALLTDLTAAVSAGLFAVLAAMVLAARGGMTPPADPDTASTPVDLYRRDRAVALRRSTLIGSAFTAFVLYSAGVKATTYTGPGQMSPLPWLVLGLVLFTASTLALLLASDWGVHIVAGWYATARGRRPIRQMTFLADAAALGVLRGTGTGYQFRHVRLQHSLAESRAVAEGTSPPQQLAAILTAAGDAPAAAAVLTEGNTAAVRTRLAGELISSGHGRRAVRVLQEAAANGDPLALTRLGVAVRATMSPPERFLSAIGILRNRAVDAFRSALRGGEPQAWPEFVDTVRTMHSSTIDRIHLLTGAYTDARDAGLPHHRRALADALDSVAATAHPLMRRLVRDIVADAHRAAEESEPCHQVGPPSER
ncbi:hypothetical protein AB0M02_21570 [Actinoplanes sp. NPDC051861]|uniref:hypothetical protein n=1 Tax=Actinoplanes sp. NPDC051861 TaxID=3155170 RepID=UPI003414B019